MSHPSTLEYARPAVAQASSRMPRVLAIIALCGAAVGIPLAFFAAASRPLVLPAFLLGLICCTIGIASMVLSRLRGERVSPLARGAIALAAAGNVLMAIMLPTVTYATPLSSHILCQSHLRQIGQALLQYANSGPHGELPPDLATLAAAGGLSPDLFHCPESPHPWPRNPPPANWAQSIRSGSPTCDYFYLYQRGPLAGIAQNVVLLYEPAALHGKLGVNVLYADGHVDAIPASGATSFIARLQAGHNPP